MLNRFFSLLAFFAIHIASASAHASIQVSDSLGVHKFDTPAQRVATLNWDVAEQVIELGITPIAMPDIKGYNEWVATPKVPDGVADIGTRMEPNLTELAKLNPDLIIIAGPQQPLKDQLEKIAPVLVYQTFQNKPGNVERSVQHFKDIAVALGKESVAQQKIEAMYAEIEQIKQRLDKLFPNGKPNVSAFRFASTTTIYLYGKNSSTMHALDLLGFKAAIPMPDTQWGVTQKRVKDLYATGDGIALYFQPFEQESALAQSVMWKAMPFVKSGNVASVAPSWNYGGAMSLLYITRALADSLEQVAKQG
ncbi:iron-siderophore ABC transporter substrate-binding protein [Vibrio sp. SCSIO 43136]|uniref:iron-siderophore ABC transporter substrate-binding protein n=1 Tax=Vibrio sp. SCSIO 43136 TaxID=2819101 RepID=UPI002075F69F|nr:iron-siderophore ABC transporter substrate-binding protein [Vibrio sp. SCSIO 43136]USD66048.1 iron-siderophore ABC transporter substrate-binding protein [Vibrio sp. SCSIO 43136]